MKLHRATENRESFPSNTPSATWAKAAAVTNRLYLFSW